jgi:16S rRNA (uracil1498-N3)-methyltransferase
MNRFFVKNSNIHDGEIIIDDVEDVHHITKVLRMKEGDFCEISDCAEWEYGVRLTSIEKDKVRTEILGKQKFASEPKLKITLFQGVPKQGKMEVIIQKSVELGVYSIVPVFTARTVVSSDKSFAKKIIRWQKVAGEAVKQCRRGIIPKIEIDVSFSEMVEIIKAGKFDTVLFPYENE